LDRTDYWDTLSVSQSDGPHRAGNAAWHKSGQKVRWKTMIGSTIASYPNRAYICDNCGKNLGDRYSRLKGKKSPSVIIINEGTYCIRCADKYLNADPGDISGEKGEKNMNKILRTERTKKGLPAYWEAGGGFTNTGEATIIAGKDGQPKKAIYVRGRGHLSNAHHALVLLGVGDYIIEANHHRKDFEIQIFRITDFEDSENETFAFVERVNRFDKGEWDAVLPAFLEAAVQAAVDKATCYHCREPHYVRD